MTTDASMQDTPTPPGAVVAAIDGSHRDPAVLDWAAAEAVSVGAPLHLVHAVDLGTPLSAYGELLTSPDIVDKVEQESVRVATDAKARVAGTHPDLPVTTALPTGAPAGGLLNASDGARLLVVGSARKTKAERIVLGTTSLSVVAHSPCPVVLVPEDSEITGDGRVVVGIDGSQHSRLAFQHALEAAALRGKSVTTVTSWNVEVVGGVVVTEPGSPEWESVDTRYREMAEATVAQMRAAHPDIEVTVEVHHGRAADTLVEVAQGADLLVVGSRGRGGFRGMLLGSVSQRVLGRATVPVAVLHQQ
ncbi:universal stress protein [Janibacter cremeus]|uniref:Nucleotide-binding universal stress UspA family protein n=1 Tax=Janibacter cremeus TaxID=1285192 RepID=A0A852VN34_9MICO|nr:universal stress protein [Janibacter cremeus]NYF97536.1 nucleotide-binding universal stress UspA family protein [Janibacter cremeus]